MNSIRSDKAAKSVFIRDIIISYQLVHLIEFANNLLRHQTEKYYNVHTK